MSLIQELEEIERRLEKGEDVRKDFWRIVGKIKRQQISDEEVLRRAAGLRDMMFERRVILSYRTGFILFLSVFLALNALFVAAAFGKDGSAKALAILVIEVCTIYFAFLTGRCVAARISGIEVDGFYRYSPLEFGVKVDYLSYLKAKQIGRVVLYSGAILLEHVTMLIHTLFLLAIRSSYWAIPAFFLVINLPFSYIIHKKAKTGELHRLLREYRILREVRAKSNK